MDFIQPLLSEIDRQLAIEPKNISPEKQRSPVISASDDIDYQSNLRLLHHTITASEWPDEGALRDYVVCLEKLIWQIPAFSDNGIVIDQDYAKERTSALLELRPKHKKFTSDIWNTKEMAGWFLFADSNILIITGTSQSLQRIENFGVELVDRLTSEVDKRKTLYLLSPLPKEACESTHSPQQGKDVLRQLAIQSLRTSYPSGNTYNLGFLIEILRGFKSSEMDDWFYNLTKILAYHSCVNIIISISILGNNSQDAHRWPARFLRLIQELQGKTVVKVMLISGRPIPSPVDPAIRTMSVGNPATRSLIPKGPFHLQMPSSRGGYSSLVDWYSNLYKFHQDSKKPGNSTLSANPHPSNGLEFNPKPDSFIPSNSTNNRLEDLHDYNRPDIMDQEHNTSKAVLEQDTHGFTKNMQCLNLGALQSAGSETSELSAQQWFKKLEGTTHQVIYGPNSASSTPVKVAVLDTGFAYTNPEDKRLLKPYYQRVKKIANFIDGDTDLDAKRDPSGHGTAVAVQVLKVSLAAVLYVCRVANFDGTNTAPDTSAVERAIRKAAAKPDKGRPDGGGWGVDIINMSFGWSYYHEGVRQAIDFARQNGVHLLASTSNYGLLGPPNDILYPARSDNVIAIDAADGLGEHARTAPSLSSQHSRGSRFSAPGLGLSCPNSETTWSGSSFACPIATGVTALILEFTRQPPLGQSQSVQKCLQDTPAMLSLFRRMSSEKGPDGLEFLTPWKLTGDLDAERLFVSGDIVRELRKEYGPEVGKEISWQF